MLPGASYHLLSGLGPWSLPSSLLFSQCLSRTTPSPSPSSCPPPARSPPNSGRGSYICTNLFLVPRCVLSRSVIADSLRPFGLLPSRLLCPWDSPGKSAGVGCHFLQGVFLTQTLHPHLQHWQADSLPTELPSKPLTPLEYQSLHSRNENYFIHRHTFST